MLLYWKRAGTKFHCISNQTRTSRGEYYICMHVGVYLVTMSTWFRDGELYLNRYTTNVADSEIDKLKWENNQELVPGQHPFMTLYWCPCVCYCLIYLQYTNWRDGEPNKNDGHVLKTVLPYIAGLVNGTMVGVSLNITSPASLSTYCWRAFF